MPDMANVHIRMERDLKERADCLFQEMGMNLSTAIQIFLRQTLRQGKIPFEIAVDAYDPFYSESNLKALDKSIQEAEEGKFVVKTMEELRAMEE